jgi:hypothetical protein
VSSIIKLQPFSSTPTSAGNTTLSNRDVALGKFQGYTEFEPAIFENHWQQDQLSSKMLERGLPKTFENYIGASFTQQFLQPVEDMIWMGSTTYVVSGTGSAAPGGVKEKRLYFDGIVKQALNATTPCLTITPVVLTSSNIIAKFEEAKNKVGKTLLSDANRYTKLRFIVSVVDAQKYEDALANTAYKNQDTTERGINKYKGYEIIVVPGLDEHNFFFGHFDSTVYSNLHIALTSEANMTFELNRLQNNSTLWFYKMLMKLGVGISKPTEMVVHTPLTLADFSK